MYSLALTYRDSRKTDRFGNQFWYKAAVNPDPQDGHSSDGRWTYDVFLVAGQTASSLARADSSNASILPRDDQLDFGQRCLTCSLKRSASRARECGGQK